MAGGVYKRGKSWQAVVRLRGHETICNTFDTEKEARFWYNKTKSEMKSGTYVSRKEADNTTLLEAIDRYEREILPEKKGAKQDGYRLRNWRRWPQAARFLTSIHSKDIAEYRDERLKTAAKNTVIHELALLRHVFNVAISDWGLTGLDNPVLKIRMPKMPKSRERRLEEGELEMILEATQSPLLGYIVRFALETAMRQAEITGMNWKDVNLNKRTVTLWDTKNGDSRTVPLSTEAVRVLKSLPKERRFDGQVWGITPRAVCVAFRRAVDRARETYIQECKEAKKKVDPVFLVNLTFHDLRHEATSRFFENTSMDLMKIARITGHKSLQMLSRYTHLRAHELAELLK